MYLPRRGNPFEPVDRRWLRSNHLANQRRPRWHRTDDEWIRQAVTFIQALGRCRDERQRRRLAEKMPALHLAHAIREADPPLLRWAVEARLLAAEDFHSIARKCATTPEAIEAYEKLFFCVLDKLESTDWIICHVIGRKLHYGLSGGDLDVIWKFYGFRGGPILLDNLIDGHIAHAKPESPDQVEPFLAKDARTTLLRKLALAALMLQVTPETALDILKVLSPLVDQEPRPERSTPTAGVVTPDLQALLEGLQGLNQVDGQPTKGTGDMVQAAFPDRERHPGQVVMNVAGVDCPGMGGEHDLDIPEPIRRRAAVLPTTPQLVTS